MPAEPDMAMEILMGFVLNVSPKWRVAAVTKPGDRMPFFERPTVASEPSVTVVSRGSTTGTVVIYKRDAVAACERRKASEAVKHFEKHGRLSEPLLLVCMDLAMKNRRFRRGQYKYERHLEKKAKLATDDGAM